MINYTNRDICIQVVWVLNILMKYLFLRGIQVFIYYHSFLYSFVVDILRGMYP